MSYEILLNNKTFYFIEKNFPCLVHYREKTGGSQFTVTMMADLFIQGKKILFFTAYPMARDNFLEQVKGKEKEIIYIEKKEDFIDAEKFQAVMLKSGDDKLFFEALKMLRDVEERVVLVKNFEQVDEKSIKASLSLEKIIFSGDIDKSGLKKSISEKQYKTIIAFSEPETELNIHIPVLEKFTGYMKTIDEEGIVKLRM